MTPEVTEVAASAFAYPGWFFFLLFALAMVVSSIGFKNYVWFISLGYGFSIAAAGVLCVPESRSACSSVFILALPCADVHSF